MIDLYRVIELMTFFFFGFVISRVRFCNNKKVKGLFLLTFNNKLLPVVYLEKRGF